MNTLVNIFTPNKKLDRKVVLGLVCVQVVLFFILWITASSPLLPKPAGIWIALKKLFMEEDLLPELMASLKLSSEAMGLTILLSLAVSYLTVIPFFRPIVFIITKWRFLTLVGLTFLFTLMTSSGHELKVWLLVFGMSVFFTTSMLATIKSISRVEFNHARSLRLSELDVVKEVIVLGKIDIVFEVIRQNFAISWMMLTMVEGISRSEGGIGTLLLNQNKHFNLDAIFAIQLVILAIGITQDYLFGVLKLIFCPYANLSLESR